MRFRIVASLVVVAALGALAIAGIATAKSSSPAVIAPTKITVTLKDYSFGWSRRSVKKGTTVLFTVRNVGTVQHNVDFVGLGKRSAIIAAGAKTTVKITFKKAGTVQVVCDVPRHIQLGMVSTFKVTA